MNPVEFAVLVAFILGLVGLALYFGRRQVRTLRALGESSLGEEDRHFVRRQAYRRLTSSGLMLVLAGLLVGWFFLESNVREVHEDVVARQEQGPVTMTDQDKNFIRLFTTYWVVGLLVMFALLFLAAMDIWAIARFGHRHQRQLQADHRAMMESQLARLRGDRNGHV